MADWVGACTATLASLVALIRAHVMAAGRIHGDDTTVPVLAKGKTVTGRLWTYVRDDRPFAGPAPPAAIFYYSPDRGGEHPQKHLAGYAGILQADAYAGFNELYLEGRKPGPVTEAGCWAHGRRKLFELAKVAKAPLATEAVRRIDAIFAVERTINGLPLDQRLTVRQQDVAPLVAELEAWMRAARSKMSRHADVAKAMDYMLKRWDTFSRFLSDGRICLTTDGVEKPQSSSGCSFRGLFTPRLDHPLVGTFGTLDVVHLLMPDLLDPVVPARTRLAVFAGRTSLQGHLSELHGGECRAGKRVLLLAGENMPDHHCELPSCRDRGCAGAALLLHAGKEGPERARRRLGRPGCLDQHLACEIARNSDPLRGGFRVQK